MIKSNANFEIRHYPESILAQVDIRGDFMRAGNLGFQPLLRYISGGNLSRERYSMTAPVIQETIGDSTHTVSFVLPADTKSTDVAQPADGSVRVTVLPEHYAAAVRFPGGWNDERFQQKGRDLVANLHKAGLKTIGNVYFARYDPPWKPGFLKRNEVLINIEAPLMKGNK